MDFFSILLDHPANIQDITFNAMQVGTIIGGVLGVAGSFFANKYAIEQLKAGKLALKKNAEKENTERQEEIKELQSLMNKRVDSVNDKVKELEKGIGKKLDIIQREITGITTNIAQNHTALLQALLNAKNE